ncbi:hypothetical protein [Micromonospora sp. LOL_015]|uniref:hypothetical protein n=1 Tax=Micromonospora sp. LOL_015 TaxID=3345416 RepID=UPI003A8A127A
MSTGEKDWPNGQPLPSEAEREEAQLASVPATIAGMPPTAQVYFAVVSSTGALQRGFGVVSALRLAAGSYQVIFSHDVTGSAAVGSVGFHDTTVPAPGEVAVSSRLGVPNAVLVRTYASNGNLADQGFHLAVFS